MIEMFTSYTRFGCCCKIKINKNPLIHSMLLQERFIFRVTNPGLRKMNDSMLAIFFRKNVNDIESKS